MRKHKHTILYAEDDLDDLFIVQQAFEEFDETVNLIHAHEGFETLQLLEEMTGSGSLPCLIILDINMPGMNGREALVSIKENDRYKNIPVVLFTTSSSRADQEFAEKWGANFITKPVVYSELEELAKSFINLCGEAETTSVVKRQS
jgi:CheY-like chemotaxis protein